MKPFKVAGRRPSGRILGFTLIELMVGMTLGVIVLFALVTLFVNNSRMRRETDQASQQIENGRYALDLLRDDLHLAGYYGDAVPQQGFTVAAGTIPSVCATDIVGLQFVAPPAALQWPVPVFGIAGGDGVPTCVSSATGGQKAGTDILVVRDATARKLVEAELREIEDADDRDREDDQGLLAGSGERQDQLHRRIAIARPTPDSARPNSTSTR